MTITEAILAKLQHLSPIEQQHILDTINKLPGTAGKNGPGLPTDEALPAKPSIWAKLQAIGQLAEESPCDLPTDLAANHDFYLHGLPRRP